MCGAELSSHQSRSGYADQGRARSGGAPHDHEADAPTPLLVVGSDRQGRAGQGRAGATHAVSGIRSARTPR